MDCPPRPRNPTSAVRIRPLAPKTELIPNSHSKFRPPKARYYISMTHIAQKFATAGSFTMDWPLRPRNRKTYGCVSWSQVTCRSVTRRIGRRRRGEGE